MLHSIIPFFITEIPDELLTGVLYISEIYGTAAHLCACGCKKKTITPLKPLWGDGWDLIKTGDKITLRPSIGNFNGQNPYHAHYFITNNNIEWCGNPPEDKLSQYL